MDELLTRVLDAHGGSANWSTVRSATAKLSIAGPFWEWKGRPDIYQRQTVTFDPHREHITFTPFTGTDRCPCWMSHRTASRSDHWPAN